MQEIERKFLVKTLPSLSGKSGISYERYFLKIEPEFEERIQRKDNKFELETKLRQSSLTRKTEKREISKEQFEELKKSASKSLLRTSYKLSEKPNITLKVYHGDYEGLIRAEVEFLSEKEAQEFIPLDWMGKEITETDLGKDSKLINLNGNKFEKLLKEFN